MNDLKLDGLTGKTIKEAEVDGFGIRMVFTDGAVFDYDASDGGYSQYELTEATADAMQKQIDHTADIGKKVSISCGRENDLISRQEALKELAAYIHLIDKTMGKGTLTDDDCMEAAESVLGEDELPAAQPATSCSEIPNGSDDTISRQMALDALDEQIEQCNKALGLFDISPKDEYAIKVERASLEAYKEQLENIPAAQPEQKTDEWIPISKETNPTKSGWYLVTVHEDVTNDNERFTGMAEFNATNGMWYDIDEPTDMYLRWMPLPEPYRGGDSE